MKTRLHMLTDIYDGHQWEELCGQLLKFKHGDSNIFKVPATFNGDGGIDYHTPDGIVYQCYAPEEEYQAEDLYIKMRGKITTDLGKLTSQSDFHNQLFQNQKIKRWMLLTPKVKSKTVNGHCAEKTKEVRSLRISYIDNEIFEACANDGEFYFSAEIERYVRQYAYSLNIKVDLISSDDVIRFRTDNNSIVMTIDTKINGLVGASAQIRLVDRYVEKILVFNQIMSSLRRIDSDLYSKLDKFFKEKDSQIEDLVIKGLVVSFLDVQNEKNILKSILIQNFSSQIELDIIEKIIEGKEASWLIDCPLRFE